MLLNVIKHIGDVAGTDQQLQFAGADSQRGKRRPAKFFDELHCPGGGNKHPGHHGLVTGGAEFEIKKTIPRPDFRSRSGFGRRHRGHQHLEICRGMNGDAQAGRVLRRGKARQHRPLAMVSLDDQVAAIAKGLRLQQGARKTLDIFGDLAVTGKF